MSKIKDDISLEILRKYPFEGTDSASIFWSNKDCSKHIRIWFISRQIYCNDNNNFILKK